MFATSGVDAPVREIADRAGVGLGTVYRHFPRRADLIAAVFRREIDACADAAPVLAAEHPPFEALGGGVETSAARAAIGAIAAMAAAKRDPGMFIDASPLPPAGGRTHSDAPTTRRSLRPPS